jgi:hypothetical protein
MKIRLMTVLLLGSFFGCVGSPKPHNPMKRNPSTIPVAAVTSSTPAAVDSQVKVIKRDFFWGCCPDDDVVMLDAIKKALGDIKRLEEKERVHSKAFLVKPSWKK